VAVVSVLGAPTPAVLDPLLDDAPAAGRTGSVTSM
jgi:hypothetical protein